VKKILKEIIENLNSKGVNKSKILFEAQDKEYKKRMIDLFNKAVKDELTASISYKSMSEKLFGTGNNKLREELAQHGTEEFVHFNSLLEYASTHGILNLLTLDIDKTVISNAPSDEKGIIKFSQKLQAESIEDYRNASAFSLGKGDLETYEFFAGLASDEERHYDDFAVYTGETREFGEF